MHEILRDGSVSSWEHEHFVHALEADALLTAEQKKQVRTMIDVWFKTDARGTRAPV